MPFYKITSASDYKDYEHSGSEASVFTILEN